MKRVISSLMVAVAMLTAPMIQAGNISVDQAKDAAAHFLQHRTSLTRITADQLTLAHQWNNDNLGVASMYLFTAPTEGWIIMAATTTMHPVVGYADDNVFDVDNMAPQLQWWLSGYNEIVCAMQNADAEKALDDSPEWIEISSHSLKGSKGYFALLKTKWDQGSYYGTDYNIFCPVLRDTVCPTGCVATALAQICKYYEYPKCPVGSPIYWWQTGNARLRINLDTVRPLDYSNMPNRITTNTPRDKKEEISRLGYYIGLGVKMDYGTELSGTTSQEVPTAMSRYFKYNSSTIVERKSTATFVSKVRGELKKNRPVYMHGSSSGGGAHSGGHAWVCDGYDNADTNMFHMNWGWSGSGDGCYNLWTNNLSINGGYNFNQGQGAIINLVPPQDSTSVQIGVQEVEPTAVLGMPYPNPAILSVALPYSTREAVELQVYNVSGCLVESRLVQAGDGEVVLRVDALPAGMYIYRMGSAHGKFMVR